MTMLPFFFARSRPITTMFSPSEVLAVKAISLARGVDQRAEALLQLVLLRARRSRRVRRRRRAGGTPRLASMALGGKACRADAAPRRSCRSRATSIGKSSRTEAGKTAPGRVAGRLGAVGARQGAGRASALAPARNSRRPIGVMTGPFELHLRASAMSSPTATAPL